MGLSKISPFHVNMSTDIYIVPVCLDSHLLHRLFPSSLAGILDLTVPHPSSVIFPRPQTVIKVDLSVDAGLPMIYLLISALCLGVFFCDGHQ